MPENKWLAEIYTPRLEYAEYYSAYIQRKYDSTNSLIPFALWSKADYQKYKDEQFAEMRKRMRSEHPGHLNSKSDLLTP